jgi:long-chain fatty acid transport protein
MAVSAILITMTASAGGPGFSSNIASADSAESAANNPAGMSRLDKPSISARLIVARGIGEFEVDESQTTTGGGNPSTSNDPVFLPLAYYVRPLNKRWHAGISLTVPSGFGADYGGDWAGRYYSDHYSLVYIALTPALSYRVSDRLSLGVAMGFNYTLSETGVAIKTLNPNGTDGRLETRLDGIGASLTVSALWELNEQTRFGIVYSSQAKADLKGNLKFKNLGPVLEPLLEKLDLLRANIKVENILPQRVAGGVYHELDSGGYVSVDAFWADFSEFGTASVALNGTDLVVDEKGSFQDFWGVSVGYGFPTSEGRRYSVGAFYVTPPTDDDKRGLSLALDRIWGIGAGVTVQLKKGREFQANLNVVDYGKGPVDTGPSSVRGRVVGHTKDPYAFMVDLAYHF